MTDYQADPPFYFELTPEQRQKICAWQQKIQKELAQWQLDTNQFVPEVPLEEHQARMVRRSIEHGDPEPSAGVSGGLFSYCFTPTGLGCTVSVRENIKGESLDVTDYENW